MFINYLSFRIIFISTLKKYKIKEIVLLKICYENYKKYTPILIFSLNMNMNKTISVEHPGRNKRGPHDQIIQSIDH